MAQFINTSDPELQKFPPWRAHSWRQISRELTSIRGCAPAVHFHDTTYDSSTDLLAPDDRIFKWYVGEQMYFWGQEMWSSLNLTNLNHDNLNIYWRNFDEDDTKWVLIKGTGIYGFNAGDTVYHPNSNLRAFSTGNNPHVSSNASLSTTDPAGYPYIQENHVTGFLSSGDRKESYGPGTTTGDRNLSETKISTRSYTHTRCMTFLREGEYKIEISETGTWNASASLNGKSLPANGTESNSTFYTNNILSSAEIQGLQKFNPINYSSNLGLYATLPEQLSSYTNLLQTYRSRFTKSLILKIYTKNKDLVTGNPITFPTDITLTPGSITTASVINRPYQKVIGYGAVFEYTPSNNFVGYSTTYTDTTTAEQRFGKINQRWNGTPKTLINRRHLVVEGLTIRPSANRNVNQDTNLFPYISAANTILDLRGSIFKNCTFEDMTFNGQYDWICLSGCKFINCKFKRCAINMHADSVLFMYCDFEGRTDYTDSFNVSGISNANIGCVFENNFRTFFFATDRSPCTDNLWFRCIFDTTLFNSGGSEQFIAEQIQSEILSTPTDPTHPIPLLAKQKFREFARNMFVNNRIFDSSLFNISTYNAFSRANLYILNETFCPTEINTLTINSANNTSTTQIGGGSYYDVHFWNHYSRFSMKLGENTHHMRFINNIISEPHLSGNRWSSENGSWNILSQFPYPFFSIQSSYENPANGYWDCKHTSRATGNKIIANKIINWGGQFAKTATSPCSIYLNFYNLEHCATCNNESSNGFNNTSTQKYLQNTILDFLDEYTFISGDTTKYGKYINVAYKNTFDLPTTYSLRTINSKSYSTSACSGYQDNKDSIGTFNHITFPAGLCKETANYFNCNSIYIGTGTTYPDPYSNTFGTHGKQGNNNYRRISVPTYTNSSTPVNIVTTGTAQTHTIFTGDIFTAIHSFS